MMISVVIPSYNRADLIVETLDAIFAQTIQADEIIVVDDGSTDATRSVLAKYGGRIRSMFIANSGELVARNTGLRAAQGKLVAFCDNDDLWEPEFLAAMSAQWQAEPQLMACYCDFRILREGNRSERSKFSDSPEGYWANLQITGPECGVFNAPILERLLSFQPFFPSCMMVDRKAFLDAGGWDESVGIGSDFATVLRVASLPPLGIVRRPLVAIRKHPGNYSGDTEKTSLRDARVLEHVLQTRPEQFVPLTDAINRSIAQRRGVALDSAFSRRDFGAVREIFRMIPPTFRPRKQWLKRAIAGLPPPVSTFVAGLVSR